MSQETDDIKRCLLKSFQDNNCKTDEDYACTLTQFILYELPEKEVLFELLDWAERVVRVRLAQANEEVGAAVDDRRL
jgi:hypothetical protein